MWIDAHHHVWDPAVRPQPWMDPTWAINRAFDLSDFTAASSPTPVSSSIVVQTTSSIGETLELLDAAHEHRTVAGVVGWVDLLAPIPPQLDLLNTSPGASRLVGIRHQAEDEPDPQWLARPDVIAAIQEVGRHGLRYDLLVKPHQIDAAITLAAATIDTTMLILDHCAKPPLGDDLTSWRAHMTRLSRFGHVACKLSGLVTEADWHAWTVEQLSPIADTALDTFGPSRLMFGSDWPVCLLAASYEEVAASAAALTDHLSNEESDAVFGATATNWYSLRPQQDEPC